MDERLLLEKMALDFAKIRELSNEYSTVKLAKRLGITRQGLQYRLKREKEKAKTK